MKQATGTAASFVDVLVQRTVREVLFPALAGRSPSRPQLEIQSEARDPLQRHVNDPNGCAPAAREEEKFDGISLPFGAGQHYAHVWSYASWSDEQLGDEKRKLKRLLQKVLLRHHQQKFSRPELEDGDDGESKASREDIVVEAFALLDLFQHERALERGTDKKSGYAPEKRPRRLVHAQLALFAYYFEVIHGRQIVHEVDTTPVQRTYQQFVQADSLNES